MSVSDARIGPADNPEGGWEPIRWCQVS